MKPFKSSLSIVPWHFSAYCPRWSVRLSLCQQGQLDKTSRSTNDTCAEGREKDLSTFQFCLDAKLAALPVWISMDWQQRKAVLPSTVISVTLPNRCSRPPPPPPPPRNKALVWWLTIFHRLFPRANPWTRRTVCNCPWPSRATRSTAMVHPTRPRSPSTTPRPRSWLHLVFYLVKRWEETTRHRDVYPLDYLWRSPFLAFVDSSFLSIWNDGRVCVCVIHRRTQRDR